MTIASPSKFVVADIRWLLREFQRFPSVSRKIFRGGIFPAASILALLWRCHVKRAKQPLTVLLRLLQSQSEVESLASRTSSATLQLRYAQNDIHAVRGTKPYFIPAVRRSQKACAHFLHDTAHALRFLPPVNPIMPGIACRNATRCARRNSAVSRRTTVGSRNLRRRRGVRGILLLFPVSRQVQKKSWQ
jgi:hypothetical protein